MSRRARAIALTTSVACAMLAFSASAFATENLPKFGKCLAKAGGAYKNSGCTKLGKTAEEMKFEWEPLAVAVKFTSAKEKETGKAVLEGASGTEISCENETSKGEYGPGNQEKNVVGEFSGCKALGAGCSSSGEPSEHVNTNKLHGEPGIITKEPQEEKNIDGVDLRPEEGENLAEFACGPAPVIVRGGIVVRWQADSTGGTSGEETNKMLNKREFEYVAEKPGKQVPEEWTPNGEGISNSKHEKIKEHLEASINGGLFESAGFSLTSVESDIGKVKFELRQCEKTIVC